MSARVGGVTHHPETSVAETDVETTSGAVRGYVTDTSRVWRGIPYAAAPVGELRFRAPELPHRWRGVRDATRFGAIPPQEIPRGITAPASSDVTMDEDCLTINVIAPRGRLPEKPLPVLVYIYGGAYTSGSASLDVYDGSRLVERGEVVFVSFNYRLGALGFLDLSSFSGMGRRFDTNVGLRDQVRALEWVRDNIAGFGGDPSNVTLFGESAGGISVTTLMTVPQARGLFARAIAQSPAVAAAYEPERAEGTARDFLDILNVLESHTTEVLGRVPAEEFVEASADLKERRVRKFPGTMTFSPVIDGDFLPRRPAEVFAAGEAHPIPLIIGTTDREGALFARMGETIPTTVPMIELMFAQTDPSKRDDVIAAYPDYPGRRAATDIGGDVIFWHPTVEAAEGHSQVAPTFMYRYDFAPRLLRMLRMGATHATELPAVFGTLDSRAAKALTTVGGRSQLATLSERMQQHWLSFAQHGTPVKDWPAYEVSARSTKIFDSEDRVENDPRAVRRRAWRGYQNYR
ncbi:carboxylesterase/lipase family protein [Hoyosella subflava]|uniref:carboxylesterase/lipase family protein n=1 Tax=Hoyosella subflava TaxID=639313 RepID=UPI000674F473